MEMDGIPDWRTSEQSHFIARLKEEIQKGDENAKQNVFYVLNGLLNPEEKIDDQVILEWCQSLVRGGVDQQLFKDELKKFDSTSKCWSVWSRGDRAYRCRTCQNIPEVAFCQECFYNGNHEGHDYNIYKSYGGGACDCGDRSAMKPSGFCKHHGPRAINCDISEMPSELLRMADFFMPFLLLRLLRYYRDKSLCNSDTSWNSVLVEAKTESKPFVNMLYEFVELGSSMRHIITRTLTDTQTYAFFTNPSTYQSIALQYQYALRSQEVYELAVKGSEPIQIPPQYTGFYGLGKSLEHKTFLEELMFWVMKFEFPKKLVWFLVGLLEDIEFKEKMSSAVLLHYGRISALLLKNYHNNDAFRLRFSNFLVQLFINEQLCYKLVMEKDMLEIMIVCLCALAKKSFSEDVIKDLSGKILGTFRSPDKLPYLSLCTRLLDALHNDKVVFRLIENRDLLDHLFLFFTQFQGMNKNFFGWNRVSGRGFTRVDLIEPPFFFYAERIACACMMWRILANLNSPARFHYTKALLDGCVSALNKWFQETDYASAKAEKLYELSYHYPLHRFLALIIRQAVRHQGSTLDQVLPSNTLLDSMAFQVLMPQVSFFEALKQLCGMQYSAMKRHMSCYKDWPYCNFGVDADVLLLQLAAVRLDPDYFITRIWETFLFRQYLILSVEVQKLFFCANLTDVREEMVEGFLVTMATIVGFRKHLGLSDREIACLEMVMRLSMFDCTYSQLMKTRPKEYLEEGSVEANAEPEQICDYKAPDNTQQGVYVPNKETWLTWFDPVYLLHRVDNMKNFEKAMERYTKFVRKAGLYNGSRKVWPPFKIPEVSKHPYVDPRVVLMSKSFSGIMFLILYKMLQAEKPAEKLLILVFYLLKTAVHYSSHENNVQETCDESSEVEVNVPISEWFPHQGLACNLRHMISSISIDRNVDEEVCGKKSDRKKKVIEGSSSIFKKVINESILTMLVKIRAKLYGVSEDVQTPTKSPTQSETSNPNACVGDGKFYIQQLLNNIGEQDIANAEVISNTEASVQANQCEDKMKEEESQSSLEWKKKAREAQRKVLAQFSSKMSSFSEAGLAQEPDGEDSLMNESLEMKMYDCAICGQSSPSTDHQPLALVASVQASTLLTKEDWYHADTVLPTTEEERTEMFKKHEFIYKDKCALYQFRDSLTSLFITDLNRANALLSFPFGEESWLRHASVKTCGHTFHLDCVFSYISSLRQLTGRRALALGQEVTLYESEFVCPVCRQSSNATLPIPTDNELRSQFTETTSATLPELVERLHSHLHQPIVTDVPEDHKLFSSRLAFMKPVIKEVQSSEAWDAEKELTESPQFLVCAARHNLEFQLERRGGRFQTEQCPVRLLMVSILHTLGTICRKFRKMPYLKSLNEILGRDLVGSEESDSSPCIPVLLQDMPNLLLHIVLSRPLPLNPAFFQCLIKVFYVVVYYQALTNVTFVLSRERKNYYIEQYQTSEHSNSSTLAPKLGQVIDFLHQCNLAWDDHVLRTREGVLSDEESSEESLEKLVQKLCLPFLNVAALTKYYLYDAEVPEEGFSRLCHYVGLSGRSSSESVEWWLQDPQQLLSSWFLHGLALVHALTQDLRSPLPFGNCRFRPPSLIELPRKFQSLYRYYMQAYCYKCECVPLHPTICLLCGDMVCVDYTLSAKHEDSEVVAHSRLCGGGICIFLAVKLCQVLVLHNTIACLWDPIYLDAHGEEDRQFSRGKPMFLNEQRYQSLQEKWLRHRLQDAKRYWFKHENRL